MKKLMKLLFLTAILISLGIMMIPILHHTTEMPAIKLSGELTQPPEVNDRIPRSKNSYDKTIPTPETRFGWQVIISAQSGNANEIVRALKVAGFPAYTQQSQDGKSLTVVVGPKVRKEDAELLQETLQENFKLNGVVLRYDPETLL